MHTTVNKHTPKQWEHIINEDGKAWTVDMPNCAREELSNKKYMASIPDKRLDHCSFESFGWHHAWADTIEELVKDIKSFGVTLNTAHKEHSFFTLKLSHFPCSRSDK